ncbi:N-acetylmuramoyl-L-alanine amidase [Hydrogenispora ethanolica]|uniref:N-acetylmuramoyl-L-alanine amidase n=1 Tax=Hydrogenispora ethanolica TaxID=1082276 RepID=A0A4R1R4C5_HYDET|nr:cell wall hydrolase [Hydrogenispora ethanolica]TCL60299.1 N-acetylmuramoyl-L-alanine amidase [Hydrogenispora ethanolica]
MKKAMLIIGATLLMLSSGAASVQAIAHHQIQGGESLYWIALRNRITVYELKQANGLKGDLIYPGERLLIPVQKSKVSPTAIDTRDLTLLARLITAEAGGEPFEGKVAVASVILNRIHDARFPDSITGNVFKPLQFESVSNGLIWAEPVADSYHAAQVALRGWDPTGGAKFFFNPAKLNGPSWVWTRTIVDRIGNHVFAI